MNHIFFMIITPYSLINHIKPQFCPILSHTNLPTSQGRSLASSRQPVSSAATVSTSAIASSCCVGFGSLKNLGAPPEDGRSWLRWVGTTRSFWCKKNGFDIGVNTKTTYDIRDSWMTRYMTQWWGTIDSFTYLWTLGLPYDPMTTMTHGLAQGLWWIHSITFNARINLCRELSSAWIHSPQGYARQKTLPSSCIA